MLLLHKATCKEIVQLVSNRRKYYFTQKSDNSVRFILKSPPGIVLSADESRPRLFLEFHSADGSAGELGTIVASVAAPDRGPVSGLALATAQAYSVAGSLANSTFVAPSVHWSPVNWQLPCGRLTAPTDCI